MTRYNPTPDEIAALVAAGWRHSPRTEDEDDWFWPPDRYGFARTYREAVHEQRRIEQRRREKSGGDDENMPRV